MDPDTITIPTGFCKMCDLVVVVIGASNAPAFQCSNCQQPILRDAISWVPPEAVAALGYAVSGVKAPSDGARGCRGGACGVHQPNFDDVTLPH